MWRLSHMSMADVPRIRMKTKKPVASSWVKIQLQQFFYIETFYSDATIEHSSFNSYRLAVFAASDWFDRLFQCQYFCCCNSRSSKRKTIESSKLYFIDSFSTELLNCWQISTSDFLLQFLDKIYLLFWITLFLLQHFTHRYLCDTIDQNDEQLFFTVYNDNKQQNVFFFCGSIFNILYSMWHF